MTEKFMNPKPLHSYKDNTGVIVWRAVGVWERRKEGHDFMNFLLPPQCTIDPVTEVKTWNDRDKPTFAKICEDQLLLKDGTTLDVLQISFDDRKIWFDPLTNLVYE